MTRKLHDMHGMLDACKRCGRSQQEIDEFNWPCISDAELADREEWLDAAVSGGEAMARARKGYH